MQASIQRFRDKLQAFIDGPNDREWLSFGVGKVYVRKSLRRQMVNTVPVCWKMLDLATIEIQPRYRGKGYFKAILTQAQELCTGDGVFIESVGHVRLNAHLTAKTKTDPTWHPYGSMGDNFIWLKPKI